MVIQGPIRLRAQKTSYMIAFLGTPDLRQICVAQMDHTMPFEIPTINVLELLAVFTKDYLH